MSVQSNFSLTGMSEWLEKIGQAGKDVDDSAARAVMAGAEVAQAGMIDRAPELTGKLKAHIKIKGPTQEGNEISALVGVIHDKAYTDAETARYGMAQEFGTSSMPAHPYIRPTLKADNRKIRGAEWKVLKEDAIL